MKLDTDMLEIFFSWF